MALDQRSLVTTSASFSAEASRAVVVQPVRPTALMTVLTAQMCIYAAESAPSCSEALRLYHARQARGPKRDDVIV
jgi:hypothetical protein